MTRRPGVVLVLALLLVLLFTTLGLGVLAVGMRELHLAGLLERRARARSIAESAARRVALGWSTRRYGDVPLSTDVDARPALGWDGTDVSVTRADSTLFVIRTDATVSGGRYPDAVAGVGLLVATVDAGLLAGHLDAAMTADSAIVAESGVVQGIGTCDGHAALGTGLRAPRIQLEPGADVQGAPAVDSGPDGPAPLPALLSPDRVPDLATVRIATTAVSPGPRVVSGICEAAPDNWGSPTPGHVCHDLLPLIWAPGNLTVEGGQARAHLVVDGDLRLDRIDFHGIVLATGSITVGPDAALQGAVRGRRLELRGGVVTYDSCAVAAAATAGGLDRAFASGGRTWIPVY